MTIAQFKVFAAVSFNSEEEKRLHYSVDVEAHIDESIHKVLVITLVSSSKLVLWNRCNMMGVYFMYAPCNFVDHHTGRSTVLAIFR